MSVHLRRVAAIPFSLVLSLLGLAGLFLWLPAPAQAATVVVTNCTATGLANKIAAANNGDEITFNCQSGSPTIVLNATQILSRNLTINGGSAITLSGGSSVRILQVPGGTRATIKNIRLVQGKAQNGGALRVFGRATLDNVTFYDNKAQAGCSCTIMGGAINISTTGTLELSNSRFILNTSSDLAGAIGSQEVLTVTNSFFLSNTASVLAGAVLVYGGHAWVDNSTFVTNSAPYGGAIVAYGGDFDPNTVLALVHDEFDNNRSTAGPPPTTLYPGGGALNIGPTTTVIIEDSAFTYNVADFGGIGMGGAIASRGTLEITNSLYDHNAAATYGGALLNKGDATITHSGFLHSLTLHNSGGAISSTGSLTLATTTFFFNTANTTGGGLASTGIVVAQATLWSYNNAGGSGGAIRNHKNGLMLISSSSFISNAALSGSGGGLLNNGVLTLTNSTLVGNQATNNGGALDNSGNASADAYLRNTTVISNVAGAGSAGLGQTLGSLTLVNSLAIHNAPANCAGAITDNGHNLQFGDHSCGAGITATNALLGPLQDNGGTRVGLANIGLPTLLPNTNSPAADAGKLAACPARDERGFLRLLTCDIGATERVFALFLPSLWR